MKITICDPCAAEKKIEMGIYRIKAASGLSLSLCLNHKEFAQGKPNEKLLEVGMAAESAMMGIQNDLIRAARSNCDGNV